MHFFLAVVMPYAAVSVFLLGAGWQIGRWLTRPVPFALTLAGGDTGIAGQLAAVARESLLFSSLWRGDRRLWLTGWLMHGSLALILAGHLVGIACLGRQFCWLGVSPETSLRCSLLVGVAAGLVFMACLAALAFRRWTIPELRYLSGPSDYLVLTLLLGVAATGLLLRSTTTQADLAEVRSHIGGLLILRPEPSRLSALFLLHLDMVGLLLIAFPFSKLIHPVSGIIARTLLVQRAPIYPTPPGVKPRGGPCNQGDRLR